MDSHLEKSNEMYIGMIMVIHRAIQLLFYYFKGKVGIIIKQAITICLTTRNPLKPSSATVAI